MVPLVPLNTTAAFLAALMCFVFESLRIFIGFMLGRPPREIRQLQASKLEVSEEVNAIKSVQLEFVKHSKLTRKLIKIEKEIETLQADHAPKFRRLKNGARIVRAVSYIAYCVFFINEPPVAIVESNLFWPLMFTSERTFQLPLWVFVLVAGLAWRHIFRTLLVIFFRPEDFP